MVLRQGWPGGQEVVRARDSMGTAEHGGGFPWPHHQPIHNLEHSDPTLAPLHEILLPGCHLQLSVPSPGTAQSLCAGSMRASVAQRPRAAGSPHHRLQPPPRPDSGTPGWGQCVKSGRGGGLATLGGLRGPGKGLRAGELGKRGGRSPACGDRCGGSPVIGRDTHYKYGRS